MNFDGHKSHITTACGGLMTLILSSITIGYCGLQVGLMYTHDNMYFTSSSHFNDLDEIAKMTFDQFDDSFSIMLDIRNKTFDWLDNPYIYPNVYYLD